MRLDKKTTDTQIEQMRLSISQAKQREMGISIPLSAKQRVKKALNRLAQAAFVLILVVLIFSLVSVYIAKARGDVPTLFGAYALFVVESGSMEPTLTVGSVILSSTLKDPASLGEGDIVTFHTESGYVVTHRIIEIIKDEPVKYRTKGDNPINSPDEELLDPERVIGVFVFKVPFT